jgi:hypothetical protein
MGPRAKWDQPGGGTSRQGREGSPCHATPKLIDGDYEFNEWLLADRNIFISQTKILVGGRK